MTLDDVPQMPDKLLRLIVLRDRGTRRLKRREHRAIQQRMSAASRVLRRLARQTKRAKAGPSHRPFYVPRLTWSEAALDAEGDE